MKYGKDAIDAKARGSVLHAIPITNKFPDIIGMYQSENPENISKIQT